MRVFVTGASGWIGSAVVPELIGAGHQVVGLARSDASAAALAAAGAEVQRGTLDDLDGLREAAAASDGVIHLAFKHDFAFSGASRAPPTRIAAPSRRSARCWRAPTGRSSSPPGRSGSHPGGVATERTAARSRLRAHARRAADPAWHGAGLGARLASRGVRSSVVRLAPTVHGDGDHGFVGALVGIAREKGVSGYLGDGSNRWPASTGSTPHACSASRSRRPRRARSCTAVAEEGVPIRAIAEVIGRQLDLPVASIAPEDAAAHFGWLGGFFAVDSPASSELTRELLGWKPTHPGSSTTSNWATTSSAQSA